MKLIPELRFPDFSKDRKWELKQVDEYFNVGSSKRVLQKDWTNKGVPFYRTRELVSLSKNEPFGSEIYISESLYSKLKEKYGVPSEGDFLVSGVGTLGISYQVKASDKFYFKDGNVLWFKLKGDLNSSYFKFCFESQYIQNQINAQTSKSTVGTYTIKNAKKTEFWYPPKPQEQQKIASCLFSLDELISAHSDKLETLKDHKKGLMQNLFPQKGQKVPKYRFPEFERDGEWVEKPLIATADKNVKWSFTGGPFGSNLKASDYTESGFRIIQLQNIGDGEFNDDYKIYTSLEKADELLSCNIYSGDLILSKMGDPVGRACIIPKHLERCVMASDGIRLVVDGKKYSKYFIYSLINSKQIREEIEKKSTGSTRNRIGLNVLKEVELILPTDPIEQQKIASCLSALDELITAHSEKIEQLQQHKKGLMQGLFPNTGEIK